MKPFKYFKSSPSSTKVYRYSNYLQSRDNEWLDRNSLKLSQPQDIHDELDDDIREPIEEDIRD